MKTKQIKDFLKKHDNFFISVHTFPEPDALGSELAFSCILEEMGKRYEIVNTDKPQENYFFLPGINKIKTKPQSKSFDAAVILDCAGLPRIGSVRNYLGKIPILNIDHHISNTYFGDINIVEPQASSACEIVYRIFKKLKAGISDEVALLLYSGIAADTGFFRFSNTSASAHQIAAELLSYKINPSGVFQNIYGNITVNELAFINRTLLRIKTDAAKKIAWVNIRKKSLRKGNIKIDTADYILNTIRYLKDVSVVLIFKENSKDKSVRINLRSNGLVDVNKIAQHFNGGGHRTASGITLQGTSLRKAEKLVVGFIRDKIG